MKQSIQLRLGQHLTMTPQLQQAIRLLQLSTLELQMEVQEALETNLMLENGDDDAPVDNNSEGEDLAQSSAPLNSKEPNAEQELTKPQSDIPDDLPVDSAWEDIYDAPYQFSSAGQDDDREMEPRGNPSETLQQHLLWQLNMSQLGETDTAIATTLIDSISDDGYLSAPLEEIHQGLRDELDPIEIDFDEVEAVLHRIHTFDPPGVGARDVRECLHIQLQQLDPATPHLEQAQQLVDNHLDLLAGHNQAQLVSRMGIAAEELHEVVSLVRSLSPRPGSLIATKASEYVIPDVFVKKDNGVWRLELNQDAIPKLRINQHYRNLVRKAGSSEDTRYLRNHLQEARWFIKSLQSRHETLLKVSSCIVERQQAFLEQGDELMKPLVLRDIAEAVGMHESTISRVTNQKYMHTPRGVFELKYFFSSHVGTTNGGECSATAIRAMIKKHIASEDSAKPLSDHRLAELLHQQGMVVARRTVAKYREAMSIPPSNERRRLI